MLTGQYILIAYIVIVNTVAYGAMCFDKYQAKRKGSRIAERTLFIFAFLLGAIGIYGGMKTPVYHKSAKPKFKIGIPILIILNLIFCALFFMLKI
ncbi:MAG: DUF1294 domain-containing protein [Bacteroidetes bacterium]|nr:DUF1294 domain-containing protein [Bacteroidota bacterium]